LRREKTSVSQEDYLKAIWEMLEEDQMPISARLAEELKVTPPAVTAALKRMTRDGHVRVERSGRIDLTQKGRKRAEHLALRHQLAEMLLGLLLLVEGARTGEHTAVLVGMGGLLLLLALMSDGALGVWPRIGRRLHRVLGGTVGRHGSTKPSVDAPLDRAPHGPGRPVVEREPGSRNTPPAEP